MAKRHDISAEYARQLLDYDPETGILTWKARTPDMFEDTGGIYTAEAKCKTWNKRFSGKQPGWKKPSGYRMVCFEYAQIREHHLIWLMMTGEWPLDQIDHKNGVRDDNRFDNLREAIGAENQQNMKRNSRNTSGFTGVSWHGQCNKWVAYLTAKGRRHSLGLHTTKEEAYAAYLEAKSRLHTFQPTPRD